MSDDRFRMAESYMLWKLNINYIMKKLFVVFVTLVSCLVLNAQENKVKSIVELNGTKDSLFGYVSQYPDGSYLVETDAADIFYYSASEVKRVSAIPLKSKGYMGLVEANVGLAEWISIVNGYRFSPNFFLGLGIGGGFLALEGELNTHFYLQARTELSRGRVKKNAPFLAFNLGLVFFEKTHYSSTDEYILPMVDITFGFRSYCRNHGALWYGITVGGPAIGLKLAYSF